MVGLILETNDLIFGLNNFSFAIDKLSFLIFEVISLAVDQLVQVINSSQLLRDVILKLSSLGRQIGTLFAFEIILIIEFVDFFSVLTISLPQVI